MAERSLKLLIAGDATGALRALGQTGNAADGVGKKFLTFGKVAAAGFASAGVAAVAFGKSAVEAAAESQKISKITEQLVKTTGGAAKISAEQVGELATALSNKTAIDDEAIQSASNLILTFKNVRNEAGKGNDIFNRATAAALDLSTVMGTDASGAAMQLAKALDNPLKGVTALQRSGVSFTAQQKEQIKTLVESGKTLEAQKIILKEVESQVGGAAAASATSAERAKIAFGNLQEQIGGYLLPVVEKVSNYLVTTFIPKLAELAERYGPMVGAAFQKLGEIMKPVFEWLRVNVPIIFDKVKEIVSGVIATITGFWEKHKEDITRIVSILWETLKGVIEGGIRIVKGIIDVFLGVFKGDWDRVWNGLKDIVSGAWTAIGSTIKGFASIMWEAAKFVFDKVKDGIVAGWEGSMAFVKSIPGLLTAALSKAGTYLLDVGKDIVDGLWAGIKSKGPEFAKKVGNWVKDNVSAPVRLLLGIYSPSKVFAEIGANIGAGLAKGIEDSGPVVKKAALAQAETVKASMRTLRAMAQEAAHDGNMALATALAGQFKVLGRLLVPLEEGVKTQAATSGRTIARAAVQGMGEEVTATAAEKVAKPLFAAMAGEAARTGYKTISQPLFAAMAGEAARNGTTVYTPLAGAMAGEAARNGNQVAKPLFAAMAGEAARNGAQQIAGALRMRLEVEARNLGYDMGNAMSEEITGSLEEVIGKMTQRINRNIGGAIGGGGGGMGGGQVFAGGPGGGPTGGGPIDVEGLYGGFTGTMGDWARNQLKELADWNRKWNPDPGTPQVRVFAPNPITGGTLTDAQGNGVYLDDAAAVREALGLLVPQMAAGGIVTGPTLAMIGEAGPEAIVPLNRAGGYGMGDVIVNVTGSVISERDLVESIRKALIVDQQRGKILIPTY